MAKIDYALFAFSLFQGDDDEADQNIIGPDDADPRDIEALLDDDSLTWTQFILVTEWEGNETPEIVAYGRLLDYGADEETIIDAMNEAVGQGGGTHLYTRNV